jgi:hypothetical protein
MAYIHAHATIQDVEQHSIIIMPVKIFHEHKQVLKKLQRFSVLPFRYIVET